MTAWQYNPAPDLPRTLLQRLADFPRQPDLFSCALRTAGAVTIRGWLATYFRFSVTGREHLPASRSFILVSNHASHLDTLCLLSSLPLSRLHRAHPAAAADYFFSSQTAGALSGLFINALPFDRKRRIRQSLDHCRRVLDQPGSVLILFPEGTRSTTGRIASFKPGIGELVAGTSIPVVPCYLDNAGAAWPKGSALPRPRRVTLSIGQPHSFNHLTHDRQSFDIVSRDLEQAVRRLACSFQHQRMVSHERNTRYAHDPAHPLAAAY